MRIGGNEYSRETILRYVGHPSQIGGTRHYELTDGAARGMRAVDFDTGRGFRFTVLPDRGMDISAASYKGTNLVYRTPNWEMSPQFADTRGRGWLRTFFGGLLTTCGLTHFGPPCQDEGEELGMHGRQNLLPARSVRDLSGWAGDEYELAVAGVVEDVVLFGARLRLERTIHAAVGSRSLQVQDVITNVGRMESPFNILYHINGGFPLLSAEAELFLTRAKTEPINEAARQAGTGSVTRFEPPRPDFVEQVYLHRMKAEADGYATAALLNRSAGKDGIGLYVRFPISALPNMTQWKMLGDGEYVLGIEPCNVDLAPRSELRRRGILPTLKPGQQVDIDVEIGVVDGADEIEALSRAVEQAEGVEP